MDFWLAAAAMHVLASTTGCVLTDTQEICPTSAKHPKDLPRVNHSHPPKPTMTMSRTCLAATIIVAVLSSSGAGMPYPWPPSLFSHGCSHMCRSTSCKEFMFVVMHNVLRVWCCCCVRGTVFRRLVRVGHHVRWHRAAPLLRGSANMP